MTNRPNVAQLPCGSVHPRRCVCEWLHKVAWGQVFTLTSACRPVICELMSSERAQWHFVPRFSWWWRRRCMDMPICVPDLRCPFEESVTSTDMLRTSRVPESSVCAKILVAFARRIMFQAHRVAETCERGPKGPGRSCSKMCARQYPDWCGVCHEPRSVVHMFPGQWSLPLSSRCIDTIRPSVLVKLSCRLCRLVFCFKCATPQVLRSRARLASLTGQPDGVGLRTHFHHDWNTHTRSPSSARKVST